nr:threonine/serine exporter family protein [Luteolibacter marinus]
MKVRFLVRLGRALHQCGASSQRVERHLGNTARMLGLRGTFLLSPTTFTCAFWVDDELDQFVHIERLEPADYNLGRLWEIDRLVESMDQGVFGFEEGVARLDAISTAPPHYSVPANALAWTLTGAAFAAIISTNPLNVLAAALISLLIYFMNRASTGRPAWKPVFPIAAAFVAGLLAAVFRACGADLQIPLVALASIIAFVPGLALAISLTEISTGHLISGTSRLVDAFMTLLKLLFGVFSGVAVAGFLRIPAPGGMTSWNALPDWALWPALGALSLGLGIIFDLPWRKMVWGLFASAIAFGAARFGEIHFGIYAGMFLGALAVGLYGNLFARITRGPGSILMIHGILLLVPGSKTYSILNHWVSGVDVLPYQSGSQALLAFIALIAGLLFSNALLPPRKSL